MLIIFTSQLKVELDISILYGSHFVNIKNCIHKIITPITTHSAISFGDNGILNDPFSNAITFNLQSGSNILTNSSNHFKALANSQRSICQSKDVHL
jgi:hypothetical protein